jgi:Ras-related protein Rab-11A
MKLYFSYASEDIESFHLTDIINAIEQDNATNRVFYWTRECEDGISHIDYMTEKVLESDCIIVFCSQHSKQSITVNQEIGMALATKKKIVPIFRDFDSDVHNNLKDRRGVKFDDSDDLKFQNFMNDLYFLLTNKKLLSKSSSIELKLTNKNKQTFRITCKGSDLLYTVLTKFCDDQNLMILNLIIVNSTKKELTSNEWTKPMNSIILSFGTNLFYIIKKMEVNYMFRLALIGSSATGKTNLMTRYVEDKFLQDIHYEKSYKKPEATFKIKDYTLKTEDMDFNYRLQIWDLNGDKEFAQVRSTIYRVMSGILLVVDITNVESFESLVTNYIPELDKYLPPNTPRMLVVNKCDLKSSITDEFIDAFMKKANISDVFHVSAKIGNNIDAPFKEMVKRITLYRIHQNLQIAT